jgi:CxxC motif-containing protein (DUF1111 family)
MRGPHWGWYLLIGVAVLAPAGIRLLTWPGARRQALDPDMVQAGQTLFHHEWKPNDPLSAGGDGLGPVYNAASCVACHNQAGPGGAGGWEHNVTTYTVGTRNGVVHAHAVNSPRDTLQHVHPDLPPVSQPSLAMLTSLPGMERSRITVPAGVLLSQRNTPALFGANRIDALPDRVLIANERKQQLKWGLASGQSETPSVTSEFPVGRALRLPDGRIGRFGWKAQSASLSEFVQAACANELGLSNPGAAQPSPLAKPTYRSASFDLTREQCDQITAFVASLSSPRERLPDDGSLTGDQVLTGKRLFRNVGCADCHTPDVGGIAGLYSDLLLHDMGAELQGGGFYYDVPLPSPVPGTPPIIAGPGPGEWRTPPLWGVADSAPYLHDGRAPTLETAIQLHKGQAAKSAEKFARLSKGEQNDVVAFLKTLRAP